MPCTGSIEAMLKTTPRVDRSFSWHCSTREMIGSSTPALRMEARLTLAGKSELGNTIFHNRLSYGLHFFTATVVPRPGWEVISNSSIKRRTPGSPSPRLPEVEKPSRSA